MLRKNPTLRHILGRAGWYFVTFLVAVTVNFFLPRLGDANPIDAIMARGGAMDSVSAREKEDAYLREFGLAETDANGKVERGPDGKPVKTSLASQFVNYVEMSLSGDLGTSILQYPKPVSDIILDAIPWTIALQLPTIILGWLF